MKDTSVQSRAQSNQPASQQRRKLLQGGVFLSAASLAPAVLGKAISGNAEPVLSGKLLCKIYDPIKTLVLTNHSNQAVVIDQLSKSALMFDGHIVDCNTACLTQSITIPANQEVQIQFDKRQQISSAHRVEDYRRIQSRVTRLSDGTRVIPFAIELNENVATFV